MDDFQATEQIGIDFSVLRGPARLGLRIDSLQSHLLHQALDPLVVDGIALAAQMGRHARPAVEWRAQILLVNEAHQLQVLGRFSGRLVVPGRTVQPQQFTLAAQAQCWMLWLDEGALLLN
jgi:hypothetical protein